MVQELGHEAQTGWDGGGTGVGRGGIGRGLPDAKCEEGGASGVS